MKLECIGFVNFQPENFRQGIYGLVTIVLERAWAALRPSHQTLKRCPSGWGKGLSCCPSLRYFIKHICQKELDNERSFLAKHEAVRPTKYLVWQRNGSKNGVPSFDYLRLVADDNIAVADFSIV